MTCSKTRSLKYIVCFVLLIHKYINYLTTIKFLSVNGEGVFFLQGADLIDLGKLESFIYLTSSEFQIIFKTKLCQNV